MLCDVSMLGFSNVKWSDTMKWQLNSLRRKQWWPTQQGDTHMYKHTNNCMNTANVLLQWQCTQWKTESPCMAGSPVSSCAHCGWGGWDIIRLHQTSTLATASYIIWVISLHELYCCMWLFLDKPECRAHTCYYCLTVCNVVCTCNICPLLNCRKHFSSEKFPVYSMHMPPVVYITPNVRLLCNFNNCWLLV